ncbi:thiamine phosphate synthase [Pontixanthobacter aquaemixtae]|uniref:Thiamine phosphate synthase n=1 Tax=Pontixanthobacter aquaemixtae TaxID=1958940 RepID=A0A845A1W4_9SPHN|nr:thiamine phosphate synthase [Pontixanthobacter aquaemixtae]MXO91629.1 thiamine phosphate synthase [Pontixanthobacter aquaemixtae]
MTQDQSSPEQVLPKLWLLSDARNDNALESALANLPRGSGFIYRHYHLGPDERRARFAALQEIARKQGHLTVLSDTPVKAKQWKADGIYGAAGRMPKGNDLLKLVTAHDWKEIVAADRAGADGILLSPIFATRSHPGTKPLGPLRFRMLARKAKAPIIALGGMNAERARRLDWPRWAAIDGLS